MKRSIILKSAATIFLAALVLLTSVMPGNITAKAEGEIAASPVSFTITDTDESYVEVRKEDIVKHEALSASFAYHEEGIAFVQEEDFYPLKTVLEDFFPGKEITYTLEVTTYDDTKEKVEYTNEEIKDLYIYETEDNIYSSAINGAPGEKWASKIKDIKIIAAEEELRTEEVVSEATTETSEETTEEETSIEETAIDETSTEEATTVTEETTTPQTSKTEETTTAKKEEKSTKAAEKATTAAKKTTTNKTVTQNNTTATTKKTTTTNTASAKKVTTQASTSKKKVTTQASTSKKKTKTYKWVQKVTSKYNGLAQEKSGTWYYLKNGKPNFKFSSLVYYYGTWFYVKKGVIDWKYSNLVFYNGTWFYVHNGKIDWNYSTLSQVNKKGAWFKVTNGMVDWNYNGLYKYKKKWFYIRNGVWDKKYSDLIFFKNTWFYIHNGFIDTKYSSLVLYYGTWYYVYKGKINWNLSTLGRVNNKGAWYKVTNGVLDWNYTGLYKYKGVWRYIKGGVWQSKFNNLLFANNKWYFVNKGNITFKYTNLVQYNGYWFYVKKSVIDWNARTLARVNNKGAWYYVNGGMIDWNYNGKFKFNGTTYKVVNGVATPVKKLSYYDGIDVSNHNGKLDWASIKKGGTKFAIIRIGWGNDSYDQDDPTALYNMQQCEKYGIPYGVYIYSYALSNKDVDSEVKHTIRMIKGRNPQLGIWFDMEDADSYKVRNGMNPYTHGKTLTNFCLRFMKGMKAKGYYNVGVYANPDYFWNVLDYKAIAKEGMVWLAHWEVSKPASDFPHVMWQYGGGPIKGASGDFDLDRVYSNSPLAKYLY